MELPSVCVIVKGKFTFTPTLNVCRIPLLRTIPVPRELVFSTSPFILPAMPIRKLYSRVKARHERKYISAPITGEIVNSGSFT